MNEDHLAGLKLTESNVNTKRKLIYIMAPARSGSTLLTYLLSNVNGIATVGELKATEMGDVEKYQCSCGQLITECKFWSSLTERLQKKDIDFSVHRPGTHFTDSVFMSRKLLRAAVRGWSSERLRDLALGLYPRAKMVLKSVLKRNFEVIDEICKMQNCDIFLDDSKSPSRLKYFCKSGLWDVFIISLTRDGRGVVTSYMKTTEYTVEKAVSEWLHICNEIEFAKKELSSEKLLHVSYEDICRDATKELKAICDFVGLPTLSMNSNTVLDRSDKHIIGNQMRLQKVEGIKLDERWKEVLVGENLAYFEQTAAQMNNQLGYM